MKNRIKAWGLGLAVWGAIAACAPVVHELGDEPKAGNGGGGGKGGSGTLPNGGTKATPPPDQGGAPHNAGGAPTADCFSPTQNVELSLSEDAVGCPCNATDPACVGSQPGETPVWYGMLECENGRWKSVPNSCDKSCFSPTDVPQLALTEPDAGCACNDDPPECVLTEHQGRPWRVSFSCFEGKWTPTEDGVCGDGRRADCRIDDVTYPHGARRVPNPFSVCNTCTCDDGELVDCSGKFCADTECTEGSYPARRCVECGPVDECLEVEIGCLSGPECETGNCEEGRCG